jgi:predicted enzyme related to lactoylglutathione lyase
MPTITHFDLPVDDPERTRKFYEQLFDWKIDLIPQVEYYLVETKGLDGGQGVGGGLTKRQSTGQTITDYMRVDSVDSYMARVEELGGKIVMPKQTVPG